jgi:hypothetical protein
MNFPIRESFKGFSLHPPGSLQADSEGHGYGVNRKKPENKKHSIFDSRKMIRFGDISQDQKVAEMRRWR